MIYGQHLANNSPIILWSLLTVSTVETIYMSVLSTLIAALLGLPLGFLTF